MYLSQRYFMIVLCVAFLSVPLSGCGDDKTPQGPEEGSVQAYLDAHPEILEEEEEVSEEEEFSAGGEE